MREREITYEQYKLEPKRKYVSCYTVKENVVLTYREEGLKHILKIIDYPYYFCVRTKDFEKHGDLFRDLFVAQKIKGYRKYNDYTEIIVRCINRKAMDEKAQVLIELTEAGIETFEADLRANTRFLIDHKLELDENPRVLYFDIETDDRGKGIVVGRDRVLSIAMVNQDGKVFYYTGEDEKTILKKFLMKLEGYDLITGWNSEKFDLPYLKARVEEHNIYYNWKEILHVDLMQKLMEVNKRNMELIREVRSFALDAVSKHFLGEGKTETTMGTWDLFTKAPEKLKEYNIQDVILLKKLDEKLKILRQKLVEHTITGAFLDEYAVSRILDIFVLRNADKFGNIHFKTKPNRDETSFDPNREAGYVGGYVIPPERGIHKNIYHFDFTSLYPSIIQTFNISPETWLGSIDEEERTNPKLLETLQETNSVLSPNMQAYSTKQGIIPLLITDLLVARNEIRRTEMKKHEEGSLEYETLYYKQYAFKTIANSFYGILGAPFTRYYKRENAEAITLTGHYLIKLAKKWFESEDLEVLYGDTDSVFVKSNRELDQEDVHKRINAYIAYHLFTHFNVIHSEIDLKIEDHYESILLLDKKKYVINKGGKLIYKGIEARRREALPFGAKTQLRLLEMLLLEETPLVKIKAWIEAIRDKVISGDMTKEELILQVRLSKDVEDYVRKIRDKVTKEVIDTKPSKLPHVKVAMRMMEAGVQEDGRNTWEKGSYVKFIVTNATKTIEAEGLHEYKGEYDHNYYWDVKIYSLIKRIIIRVYPEENWEKYHVGKQKKKRVKQQETLL